MVCGTGLSGLWSHQRTSLACGWLDSQSFFRGRCYQRTLAARKHELWECPGNNLINHTHLQESDHLVKLAQEHWDTDQVLFAHGLMPRDWLLASEFGECTEARMWGSNGFSECAKSICWSPPTDPEAAATLPKA